MWTLLLAEVFEEHCEYNAGLQMAHLLWGGLCKFLLRRRASSHCGVPLIGTIIWDALCEHYYCKWNYLLSTIIFEATVSD